LKQNEKYDEKLLRILDSACRIFAEKGYHNASVRDVAAATGVSPAGLYYYFQSKEELLHLIMETSLASLIQRVEEELAEVKDPAVRLRTILRAHLDQFKNNGKEMRVLVREWAALSGGFGERIRSLMRRYVRILMDTLRELAPDKNLQQLRAATFGLFGMLTWVDQWYRPDRDLSLDLLADEFAAMIMGNFIPSGGRKNVGNGGDDSDTARDWSRKGSTTSILSGPGF
jgi:AcrR family transcriptional regulator